MTSTRDAPDAFAPAQGAERGRQVRRLFSEIAPRYDLLNHVLSLNVDRGWRRRAVAALGWEARREGVYLDACAGTFDLSLELARRPGFAGRVVGSDFALPMLVQGVPKLRGAPVRPVCADALRLPFPDATFAGATVGFGVRNLADLDRGLAELRRVLASGARLVVLEFTTPPNALVRALYQLYFHQVLPRVGRWVSGHPWAYSYLPASVGEFPAPRELAERMRRAGFADARWRLLTGGIAALHVATA
jgi:demethylmenaquinone methyltransferase / 2-methoxy-6-polyprenyl-1,4-benzoquinol methylase